MKIAVKCGRIIDGSGKPPILDGVILIQGPRILEVGGASRVKIPTDSQVIDCSGDTVLPGLIDAHSHFIPYDPNAASGGDGSPVLGQPSPMKTLNACRNILDDMRAGVTTIRSLGSDDGSDIDMRDSINAGAFPGPRVLASGIPIRPSHGTAPFLGRAADGVDGVRKAVRQSVAAGADVIKVFATNIQAGKGELAYLYGDLTRTPGYTKEELAAVVEEAHSAGIRVAAHAIGGPALRWAMEAGVDSVEHANLLEDRDIDVFVKTGCVLCDPNLYLFFDEDIGFSSRGNWGELPEWWRRKVSYAREQSRIYLKKAYEAGVPFALALDSSHGMIWREAKCMVDVLGASPMDALMSLTSRSAELCGLDGLGTLQKGSIADMISVPGDPLGDITRLKDVRLIMREGIRHDAMLQNYEKLKNSIASILANIGAACTAADRSRDS